MKNLIELGVAIDTAICAVDEYDGEYDIEREKRIQNAFMALSTIDATPIKYGRWKCSNKYENAVCSVCGYDTGEAYGFGYGNGCYNFCPNCGAKMDRKDSNY